MSKQKMTSNGKPMFKVMASIPSYKQGGEDQLVEVGLAFGGAGKDGQSMSVQLNTLPIGQWSGRLMIFPMIDYSEGGGGGRQAGGGGGGGGGGKNRPRWEDDERGGGGDVPF